jgi:hypothetical protein
MKLTFVRNTSVSVVLLLALLLAAFLPAQAASQPVITQLDVVAGERVQVQINYLPANTDFTVTEGAAGSQGIGHLIAHFNSNEGGTRIYWFEVLADINTASTIDLRIDSGTGIVAYATVVNTGSFTAPTAVPVVNVPVSSTQIPLATLAPASRPAVATVGQISIVKVEHGGIVVVAIRNLPANTTFTVTINQGGTAGIGGSKVGQLDTTSALAETVSTFEIPVGIRYSNQLDLRLEGGGYVYVIEFNNQDFNT